MRKFIKVRCFCIGTMQMDETDIYIDLDSIIALCPMYTIYTKSHQRERTHIITYNKIYHVYHSIDELIKLCGINVINETTQK